MTNKSDTPDGLFAGEKNLASLRADSLWGKAVGVYYGSTDISGPMFEGISKERYDEIVRPDIENLERELNALKAENERLNLELQKRDKCAFIGPMRDCPTHGDKARSTK